jgi:hypothetical protein
MTFETAEKFRPNADMQETDALIYLLRGHIIRPLRRVQAKTIVGPILKFKNRELLLKGIKHK